jgi:hypothetical protein
MPQLKEQIKNFFKKLYTQPQTGSSQRTGRSSGPTQSARGLPVVAAIPFMGTGSK